MIGTDVEQALDERVPRWIADARPPERPRYVGTDITWSDRLALPEV